MGGTLCKIGSPLLSFLLCSLCTPLQVLPHVPDAKAFFEEDLGKKNPVIKTGAEIPFTRYFYKYQAPASSDELAKRFNELEASVDSRIKKLFGGN